MNKWLESQSILRRNNLSKGRLGSKTHLLAIFCVRNHISAFRVSSWSRGGTLFLGQIINIIGIEGHTVSAVAAWKQPETIYEGMSKVPIKLYLPKQAASQIWPTGYNLPMPGLYKSKAKKLLHYVLLIGLCKNVRQKYIINICIMNWSPNCTHFRPHVTLRNKV